MNDNLTALLEKLATKLGTTAEHLWRILLVQAKVSATNSLIFLLLAIFSGILLYRFHKWLAYADPKAQYSTSRYDDNGELYVPLILIPALMWGVFSLCILFDISNIINGYFNPEYWALEKVLDTIK